MTYPPAGIPLPTRTNATARKDNLKNDINTLSTAINDLAAELGSDPAGASATLTARLTGIEYISSRTQILTLTSDNVRAHGSGGLVMQASGGATVLTLGPGGGQSATFADGVQVTGQLQANATTDCNAADTGSIVCQGGAWVEKQLRTGDRATIPNIVQGSTTKTANYPIVAADHLVRADATSGSITITLPSSSLVTGQRHRIERIDATGNLVTVAGTINGLTNYLLSVQYEGITVEYNGTAWEIVS